MTAPGIQRIWYQPVTFATGLTVTAKLYDSQNVLVNGAIEFQEMAPETGIYYSDINFSTVGKFIMVFSENGTRTIVFIVEVGVGAGIVTYARAG